MVWQERSYLSTGATKQIAAAVNAKRHTHRNNRRSTSFWRRVWLTGAPFLGTPAHSLHPIAEIRFPVRDTKTYKELKDNWAYLGSAVVEGVGVQRVAGLQVVRVRVLRPSHEGAHLVTALSAKQKKTAASEFKLNCAHVKACARRHTIEPLWHKGSTPAHILMLCMHIRSSVLNYEPVLRCVDLGSVIGCCGRSDSAEVCVIYRIAVGSSGHVRWYNNGVIGGLVEHVVHPTVPPAHDQKEKCKTQGA